MNENKLVELGKRVYNGKMQSKTDEKGNLIYSDENDIKELCKKTFGDGSTNPEPTQLHIFNNIVVKTADAVAEPQIKEMMSILANYQKVKPTDNIIYDIPQVGNKPKILYSAVGATADLIRLTPDVKQIPAMRRTFTFAAYYNPLDFVTDSVKAFNNAINEVAKSKVELYFNLIRQCIDKAVKTSQIPASNNLMVSDIKLSDYQKLESRFVRMGGRPVLIADTLLIDKIAGQYLSDPIGKMLLTDEVKDMLRESLSVSKVSKSIAFNINNPWIDNENTKLQYPVNEGYIFSGSLNGKKPLYITEFGGTRQTSKVESDSKRVLLQLDFEADVTLFYGRLIGKIKDDSLAQ